MGVITKNLFLTKNGPSLIWKKLDFFREIQNSVAPLIMEINKIFTELVTSDYNVKNLNRSIFKTRLSEIFNDIC